MTGNATITNHISTHGTIRKSHKDKDTHIITRIHLYKRNQLSLPQRKDCQLRMDASDYIENRTNPKTETINTMRVFSMPCVSTQCLVCLHNNLCVYSKTCVSTQCLVCLRNALCVYSMPCVSTQCLVCLCNALCVYSMPCVATQCLVSLLNTLCVYSMPCLSTHNVCVYTTSWVSTQCLVCLSNAMCVYSMPCVSPFVVWFRLFDSDIHTKARIFKKVSIYSHSF